MLWTHIYYHISRGIFKNYLQEEVTEFVGNCSFRTCCELIYITTFQEEYLKITSKRKLLNSWEIAAFEHVVNSYILPHFKRNILKMTPRGSYWIRGNIHLSNMLWTHIYYHISRGIFKNYLQEEVTEFVGNCSFRTCCELIYITTFQEEYFKNDSKRKLLNSWEYTSFEHVVNSYILPHFKQNI